MAAPSPANSISARFLKALPAESGGRHISVSLPWGESGNRLDIALDRGATYRLVTRVEAQNRMLLDALARCHGVAIVSQNGGLLYHLSLRENLRLPSLFHGTGESEAELERDTVNTLRHCGLDTTPEALAAWLDASPARLGKLERRLTGFARALLSYPEILVFENVFEGLTRLETELVLDWRRLFHREFPFRSLLFVDVDFLGLPELNDCISCTAAITH